MKKSFRAGLLAVAVAASVAVPATAAMAASGGTAGWTWTNNEWWNQLGYDGSITVRPCINVSGYHATAGYIRYYTGSVGNADTGRLWTSTSTGSCTYLSRSTSYQDSLDWNAPQTVFNWGINKLPWGAW